MLLPSGWCLSCLICLILFAVIILFVMATLSLFDYFTWKKWWDLISGGVGGAASGDRNDDNAKLDEIDKTTESFPNLPCKKSSQSPANSSSTIRTAPEDDQVFMFSYQDFGKVEEKTLVWPLQGESQLSASGSNVSSDVLTQCSLETTTGSKKSEGDSTCRSRKPSEVDLLNRQPECQKSFIKWVPFKDCQVSTRYDSYLDRDDSPRGVVAWEVASHSYLPRARSNIVVGDETSTPVVPVRLTISDSVLGTIPFQHINTAKNVMYSKQFAQRFRSDSGRFEYQRNRRYISTLIREGISMKATLFLQIPAKQETSRCNMKTDLLLVLLKSFLWPWEDVHVKWVPNLLTWLITILTADNAIPIFKNQIIRSNYKAVLLLSKEAARQVRHQDLVFLYNLAMLLQTSPDHVLLLQQLN